MTVNMLIQIDKLVQLLESPVFTCKLPVMLFVSLEANSASQIFVFSFSNPRNTHTCTNAFTVFSCFSLKAQPSRR